MQVYPPSDIDIVFATSDESFAILGNSNSDDFVWHDVSGIIYPSARGASGALYERPSKCTATNDWRSFELCACP